MALSMSSDDDYQKALFVKMLSEASSTAPVQHWTQGLARLAQGLMGGLAAGRDRRDREEGREWLVKALMGGNAGTSPMGTLEMGKTTPVSSPTGGSSRIYSADEPSPLDPPSGAERDKMIRLMAAEAGQESPEGQQAVASVIRNRAVSGAFGGDTPTAVMNKPWAFEPMMTPQGRSAMASLDPNSPQYAMLGQAVDRAYMGDDPTRGATQFYSPTAQAALGRPDPAWARGSMGPGQDIGRHRFFGGVGGRPVQLAQASTDFAQAGSPQAASALGQGVPPQLLEGLRSSNPYVRKQAMELAQQYLKPVEWDIKTDDAGNTVAVSQRNPQQRMIIYAPPGLAESRAAQKSEEARAREVGEAKGKRQAALPEAVAQTDLALQTIEQIRTHPGRKWGVGTAAPLTNVMPGTDTRAFGNLVGQAKSQLFRQAYESLRGGGQISNIEGVKAENALARLDTAVSQQEFEKALNDYRDVLLTAKQRMRGMAGEPAQNEGGWVDLAPGVRIRERR